MREERWQMLSVSTMRERTERRQKRSRSGGPVTLFFFLHYAILSQLFAVIFSGSVLLFSLCIFLSAPGRFLALSVNLPLWSSLCFLYFCRASVFPLSRSLSPSLFFPLDGWPRDKKERRRAKQQKRKSNSEERVAVPLALQFSTAAATKVKAAFREGGGGGEREEGEGT